MTNTQIITLIRQKITDPLLRQNSAARVREAVELLATQLFNAAEDELPQTAVTGLAATLGSKANLVGGKVPLAELPPLGGEFWGVLQKSAADPQTVQAAITAAVNGLVNGAPGALDALNELAAALGNDANFSTTVTNKIAAATAPVRARFSNGTITAYATAQLAADAIHATGAGGTVLSQVDILGPLIIRGQTSLSAPGRRVYLESGTADTLTLDGCFGTVEVGIISRTTAGTGYALVTTYGAPTVKANVVNTQGYNAVFSQYSSLTFTGNAELIDNPALGAAGERITVLQVGGSMNYRGAIKLHADNNLSVFEGLTCFGGATLDFDGSINITNKGRALRAQGATVSLRGIITTKDAGVLISRASADIFCSIDTRKSTSTAPPLTVAIVTGDAVYCTLHVGTELLAAPGVVSIANGNPNNSAIVTISGPLVQTAAPDPLITLVYLTSTGTGITAAQLEAVRTTAQLTAVQAAAYTLTLTDAGNIIPFSAAANCQVPPNVFPVGTVLEIAQEGAGAVTITAGAGVTLNPAAERKTAGQWKSVGLRQRALNDWVITNGIA